MLQLVQSSAARPASPASFPPPLTEHPRISSRIEKATIRAAGNLACRRPFRPPFPIRDEFFGLRLFNGGRHDAVEIPSCRFLCASRRFCAARPLRLQTGYVGQDGILRPIGNRPSDELARARKRRGVNPPQGAHLPYIAPESFRSP